ncbi:hypothetical protein Q3G72_023464 [Acer saccharum]|nr:hypothetical protein Q3G72_023464 [Acer saccharum]
MCLATLFVVAFLSLRSQLLLLLGADGLMPAQDFLQAAAKLPNPYLRAPTLFWLGASDAALRAALWTALALAGLSLAGLWPRLCLLGCALIYLSFVVVGAPFFNFQWDNLLIESGLLAAFLPTARFAPRRHLLCRLLLLKLYVESGIAKWQSPLGDWTGGTALDAYFETAPLPTFLAWYAHQLPPSVLHALSFSTLALELGVPWLMFGTRRMRLLAAGLLTIFQVFNALSANYGFFVYVAAALHLFLLDEADVSAIEQDARRLSGFVGRTFNQATRPWRRQLGVYQAGVWGFWVRLTAPLAGALYQAEALSFIWFCVLWAYVSCADGLLHFGPDVALGPPLGGLAQATHSINTYRLFGAITTQRIEAEIQVDGGEGFVPAHLWHKPGDPARAPDFVAPHQPRLDFQLWFYGLRPEMTPRYLRRLAQTLCDNPQALWPLFRPGLPEHIERVRIVFWRYSFSTPAQKAASGAWWQRTALQAQLPWICAQKSPTPSDSDDPT